MRNSLNQPTRGQLPSLYEPRQDWHDIKLLIIASVLLLLHIFFSYLHHPAPISDEVYHKPMVEAMSRLDYENRPRNVTTPPAFHALIGFVTKAVALEKYDLQVMRLSQLFLSALAIPCFYLIRRKLFPYSTDLRALTCLTLPIYLPFFGLLYTDPPAIAFTMISILLMLKKHHLLAALAATAGLGIRQLTIIWACFCAVYTLLLLAEEHKLALRDSIRESWKEYIFDAIKQTWPYLIPAAVFIGYSVFNKGIVSGDSGSHPVSINFSNLFMFLIVSFFLLLPINIERFRSVVQMVKSSAWWLVAGAGVFLAYLYLYKITHGYNHIYPHWFLHNMLLKFSTESPIIKLLFGIPATWMTLTFIQIANSNKRPWQLYLIYIFGLLSLVPLPMGAIRYYMMMILMFLLWSPRHNALTERAMLVIFIACSYVLIYGQSKHYFFIS